MRREGKTLREIGACFSLSYEGVRKILMRRLPPAICKSTAASVKNRSLSIPPSLDQTIPYR